MPMALIKQSWMRTPSVLQTSHLLIKRSTNTPAFSLSSRPHPSSALCDKRPRTNTLIPTRFLSTTPLSSSESESPTDSPTQTPEPPNSITTNVSDITANVEGDDKSNGKLRRTRTSSSNSGDKEAEVIVFPKELDVVWLPRESLLTLPSESLSVPPSEILEEALDNLLITLHPQNQHRAIYPTRGSTRPVEPVLGLYCPIEGGEYVIDATVHELAFQTGADVVVLDAVQLAAGEWGQFGKAASSMDLPRNPLHFSSPSPHSNAQSGSRENKMMEQEEEGQEDERENGSPIFITPSPRMTISGLKSSPIQNHAFITSGSRRPAPPTKLELFFEALVNLPQRGDEGETIVKSQPRLIYIRDYPTLASSASLWYPALLTAVQQRRKGSMPRPTSPVTSPVTIVFGMTPPLTPAQESAPESTSILMSLLLGRNSPSPPVSFGTRPEQFHDWSESDAAELAREKRLRTRLKKWEKNAMTLQNEFPASPPQAEAGDNSTKPGIILVGGPTPPMLNLPFSLEDSAHEGDSQSNFFRSTVLVPTVRSPPQERATRVARRREINELTIRMGVGAVGGCIESTPAFDSLAGAVGQPEDSDAPSPPAMWDAWGFKIEAWSNVRKIADRAMGVSLRQEFDTQSKATLEPTIVQWGVVESAWNNSRSSGDTRKIWLREAISLKPPSAKEEGSEEVAANKQKFDKLLESIKRDPDLDEHEGRLLNCIVDPASIHTTFNQVHLPVQTIDSVRTIVSLPLLYPQAFQQGILKDHSMTGCLLFGPPGTGKTLVVRALAKEAGCRMLAISPSDVMDMYVGEGEKLVKAVFSLARRLSPCVVFLDELDALFGARTASHGGGSAIAHRGVITEFMQEMDGLKSSKDDNVIVIGATNRPFDLDDAVLRRLPRRLLVDLPRENDRREILKILLRHEELASDVSIDVLAKQTEGFSGSDLKHLCVSAALDSVKEHVELPWFSERKPTTSPGFILSKIKDASIPVVSQTVTPPSILAVPALDLEHSTQSPDQLGLAAQNQESEDASSQPDSSEASRPPARVLHWRNFTQALKEITPSSSESLGSLADLRKWNEEFGQGRRDRKKHLVWGKGRFGFVNGDVEVVEDGRVA